MNVRGKVILITGGARGIGFGIAQRLALAGATVAIADIQPEAVLAEAAAALGPVALGLRADVSQAEDNARLVSAVVAARGRLDGFVACAAASRRAPFLEATEADLHFTLGAAMFGVWHGFQAAARQMVAQGQGGALLLIGSVHSLRHYPRSAAYNMAKSAASSLVRTVASELTPHRIRVNSILPGWTHTPGELAFATAEQLEEGGRRLPLGRLATPDDIGQAALYLLSEEASYVTGSELVVDGGFTLAR